MKKPEARSEKNSRVSAFPKLKTGVVAQYPCVRRAEYGTEVLRFVDGSEQRYRKRGRGRRWVIRLQLLDETELARVEEFFAAQQGRFGSFAFEDPWDGTVYADCSFAEDELGMELAGEGRGRVAVVIRENRR